jgi:hypothetical protein
LAAIKRSEWLRATVVPCLLERNCKLFESAQRDAGEKFIAIAEMAIISATASSAHKQERDCVNRRA